MTAQVFDTVTRTLPSGDVQRLTRKEFQALALSERVKAILGKQLKFFRAGAEVPVKDALADR